MIDINCDMGEGVPDQEAMMPYLTSANIACGGHAGDEDSMRMTIQQAMRHGLKTGAHPSYFDKANFGRTEMALPEEEIAMVVHAQCAVFGRIAEQCGATVTHVKPHGALYNQAVKSAAISRAIAEGVGRWRRDVAIMGLAGSLMLDVFREAGFRAMAEAFADRRYEADGTLRSRKFEDALIRDPKLAGEQALRIAKEGIAETICIHGDTPGALSIAKEVARVLRA
jgi:5-oxoprolinase (ATP-hydrolysing) subunit A